MPPRKSSASPPCASASCASITGNSLASGRKGERKATPQGEAQGITKGQAALLEHLLRRRFGPVSEATRTRLQTATPEQLESWAERLLDASDSDAVFQVP